MHWNILLKTYAFSIFFITILCTMFPILGLIVADGILAANKLRSIVFPSRNRFDKKVSRIHKIVVGGWISGGVIALLLIAGMIFGAYDFRLKEQTIALKELPPGFDGLRIVHFSDIHLGSWTKKEKLQEAVSMIMATRPDLIVFTGDMFNWSTSEGEGFQDILKQVHAPLGVFAILGNHDYGDYMIWPSDTAKRKNMDDLLLFYKFLNWRLLRNEHATIRKNGDSLALIGVENWGATKRFQRHGDITKALLGTEGMTFYILLSHDPTHWDQVILKSHPEIDLTLSGHTHGGQFGIDVPWLHWSPVIWVYKEWCGLYSISSGKTVQHLYVNQGLGNIGYAGRVGILPEITLLILKKSD
jgi:predicted MPP superfamily phosphohydrolase